MTIRCLALLSGGLDSILAIRLMQQQGVEVEAVNFKTMFTCCQDDSAQAAARLGVPLTIVSQESDYLELIRRPRFGYGKGANPCVDCRIYMFEKARRYMRQSGADFIVSGEVVGQRPMSQKRNDLRIISRHSDLDELLLRPLSAKLLSETLPEREGWIDRSKLFDFQGRSRKGLIALAKTLGVEETPAPSTGCALTEPSFSRKVFDLVQLPDSTPWDYEMLTLGRHYRMDAGTKAIVGRHEKENARLAYVRGLPAASQNALFEPDGFGGPAVVLIGDLNPSSFEFAAALLIRHSREGRFGQDRIRVSTCEDVTWMIADPNEQAASAKTIATA